MKMTQEELNKHVDLHGKWLRDEKDGVRLNLRGADLSDVILRGADLRHAILSDVILRGADLRGDDLSSAILRGADLSDVILHDADLRDADLRDAKYNDRTIFFNPETEGMIKEKTT